MSWAQDHMNDSFPTPQTKKRNSRILESKDDFQTYHTDSDKSYYIPPNTSYDSIPSIRSSNGEKRDSVLATTYARGSTHMRTTGKTNIGTNSSLRASYLRQSVSNAPTSRGKKIIAGASVAISSSSSGRSDRTKSGSYVRESLVSLDNTKSNSLKASSAAPPSSGTTYSRPIPKKRKPTPKREPEIICIDDDSEEDGISQLAARVGSSADTSLPNSTQETANVPRKRQFGEYAKISVKMVFVGRRLFKFVDSSVCCTLTLKIPRREFSLKLPDVSTAPRQTRHSVAKELEIEENICFDSIKKIIYATGLEGGVAFVAMSLSPDYVFNVPVTSVTVSANASRSDDGDSDTDVTVEGDYWPSSEKPMDDRKYVLLIQSDESVKEFSSTVEKVPALEGKLLNLNAQSEGAESLCSPYLVAYYAHQQRQIAVNEKGLSTVKSRRAKRGKRKAVVYDDAEAARVLFCYPMEEYAQDSITISVGDKRRLTEGEFLNDNIIDLQIKRIVISMNKKNAPTLPPTPQVDGVSAAKDAVPSPSPPPVLSAHNTAPVYAFSCMFYTKLTELPKYTKESAYGMVKRWTKNVDIFSKDFVFFPINIGAHWSLVCVVRPGNLYEDLSKVSTDLSEDSQTSRNMPCMIFMDSLGLHNFRKIKNHILDYLEQEWLTVKKSPRTFSPQTFPCINCSRNVPSQQNSYDCGVYVVKYVELICDIYPSSTHEDIDKKFKDHFHTTLFTQVHIDDQRLRISEFCDESEKAWERLKQERLAKQQAEKKRKLQELDRHNNLRVSDECSDNSVTETSNSNGASDNVTRSPEGYEQPQSSSSNDTSESGEEMDIEREDCTGKGESMNGAKDSDIVSDSDMETCSVAEESPCINDVAASAFVRTNANEMAKLEYDGVRRNSYRRGHMASLEGAFMNKG
mmetsp:Transcript_12245/g.18544  ORF Transcript_12245/g.18544 Transcript_12245/m.18544 type:complete len:912 (+) Transcript_12245:210-2945(+)|eukprot:CAMPEP_0185039078 /NCGR_PEP_ID=MMETSP1103-20130426/35548_1 /TAXON_ID=36769 /ORGANISM="Paraphysomonas bandaiensis, Strain Caron Lab Isolate" /LENGTH=911 /DNA_ID=CAMNT_0027577829 /DNA_START=44 /DNA_END=2779 /DNA_ORIENTATION=-